jgi:hypothetical protein
MPPQKIEVTLNQPVRRTAMIALGPQNYGQGDFWTKLKNTGQKLSYWVSKRFAASNGIFAGLICDPLRGNVAGYLKWLRCAATIQCHVTLLETDYRSDGGVCSGRAAPERWNHQAQHKRESLSPFAADSCGLEKGDQSIVAALS